MTIDRRMTLAGIGAATGMILVCREFLVGPAQAAAARADLYNCEGCEAALERPLTSLSSIVTLAASTEPGERLLLTGRVLSPDRTRPVSNVIVYAHHTNARGLYTGGQQGRLWSARHGRLRGWARTDADGRYAFRTIKPAPYPDRTIPAHVHLYIAEPGRRPYYVDDVVFAGEFGVTPTYRSRQELRGGSGIVTLARTRQGVWLAQRDIWLERHPA